MLITSNLEIFPSRTSQYQNNPNSTHGKQKGIKKKLLYILLRKIRMLYIYTPKMKIYDLIYLELANSLSLPLGEKMITATSASHRTESSKAFFRRPLRRFENVTCRLVAFSMRRICVFPRTIFLLYKKKIKEIFHQQSVVKTQLIISCANTK